MKPNHLFLSIFIFAIFGNINAQNINVDKLLKIAEATKNDSAKVAALNQLGFKGNDYGLDAKKYAKKGWHLSSKLKIKTEMAKALLNQSNQYSEAGKYDSALISLQKAQELYPKKDSIKIAPFYAKYYFSLGMVSLPQGNEKDIALKNFLISLRFAKQTNDNYLISTCYGGVSAAYNYLRQFDKAIELNKEFLDFAKKSGDNLQLAKANNNLSSSYLNAGDVKTSAIYMKEFEKLVPQLKNPYYNWLLTHNKAMAFAENGKLDQAISMAKQAVTIAEKEKLSKQKIMEANYLVGYCLFLSNQFNESKAYLLKVSDLADQLNSPEYKMYAASGLAENYNALGDYKKAVENLGKQIALSDSISSEKTKINANYLHIKNKIEQKENQIQQQQASIQQNKIINYFLIGGLLLLLIIAILGYRNYNHRKKLQQQRITELETEKQLLATQSLLKGQEEERTRIAKDLHDGLGGLLSGVKLQLGAMKGNLILTEENGNAFNQALNKLDESISEMRRVAHNMMPETLLKFGLQQATEDYSNGLSQNQNFTIRTEFHGLENRLDSSTEVVVFRIVQELINNAVKHSGASLIIVQMMLHDENLNITVEDNGKGFDPKFTDSKSAGLQNIESRVRYLNGKLDIQSEIGKGTSVYIEFEVKTHG